MTRNRVFLHNDSRGYHDEDCPKVRREEAECRCDHPDRTTDTAIKEVINTWDGIESDPDHPINRKGRMSEPIALRDGALKREKPDRAHWYPITIAAVWLICSWLGDIGRAIEARQAQKAATPVKAVEFKAETPHLYFEPINGVTDLIKFSSSNVVTCQDRNGCVIGLADGRAFYMANGQTERLDKIQESIKQTQPEPKK